MEIVLSIYESGIVKLSEWGAKISNAICMGRFGAVWMVNLVEKVMASRKTEDLIAKFNESS